jgi:hypothetical protein
MRELLIVFAFIFATSASAQQAKPSAAPPTTVRSTKPKPTSDDAEAAAGYGVQPEHYEPVGEALIWTIEHCLGSECTDEVRSAWLVLYSRAAAVMKEAAHAKGVTLSNHNCRCW